MIFSDKINKHTARNAGQLRLTHTDLGEVISRDADKFQVIHSQHYKEASISSVQAFLKSNYAEKSLNVLHVEDSHEIQLITRIFLRQDFRISSALSGESGISMAKTDRFNLVIMDINLGEGISGFETIRRIRSIHTYKNIPVIIASSNSFLDVRENAIECGADAYLQKPFTKEELYHAINYVLKSAKNLS
ncbi:MAG: response regulator [Balneolales bacterium]|nr:response regulator [Balneolales bacterium]